MFDLFFIAFSHLIAPEKREEKCGNQHQFNCSWGMEEENTIYFLACRHVLFHSSPRFWGDVFPRPLETLLERKKMCCRWKIEQTHDEEERKFSYISFRPASLACSRYCEFPSICFVIFSMINSHQNPFYEHRPPPSSILGLECQFHFAILPHDMFPSLNPNLHPQFFFHLFSELWKKIHYILCFLSTTLLSCSLHFFVSSMTLRDTHCEESAYRRRVLILQMTLQANSTSSSCRQQQSDDGTWGRDDDNKHTKHSIAMIMTMRRTKNPKQRRISTLRKLKVIIII